MTATGRSTARGDFALLLTAFIWGSTFPAVKALLLYSSAWTVVGARFAIAAVTLAIPARRAWRRERRSSLGYGLMLGAVMGSAFLAQTAGLAIISPSRSAFLTVFYVVFTPVVEFFESRRLPSGRLLLAVFLTFGGGLVMTASGAAGRLGSGELLTLLCAMLFSIHLVLLTRGLWRHSSMLLLFWQIVVTAGLALTWGKARGELRLSATWQSVGLLLFLSLIATTAALWLQNYGQTHTTATRAAVLFSLEPVWAALFSFFAGERLRPHEVLGAAVILGGVILASLPQTSGRSADAAASSPQ